MNDKQARALARRIVSDNGNARVKFGRTNGQIVLHVRDAQPRDPSRSAFTIRTPAEWDECPLNARMQRNEQEAAAQPVEAVMASNGARP